MTSLAYYKTKEDGMPTHGKWEAAGIGYGGATSTFTFTTSTSSEDSTMTE
jgi:hypothetical protein